VDELDISSTDVAQRVLLDSEGEQVRILYLRTDWGSYSVGGSISHVNGMVKAMRKVAEVSVVSSLDAVNPDIRLHAITRPVPKGLGVFRALWNILASFSILLHMDNFRPNVIYQRYSWTGIVGPVLARFMGARYILEFNGSEAWTARHWEGQPRIFAVLIGSLERWIIRHADRVVCVSDATARQIQHPNIVVVSNGVDLDTFNPCVPAVDRSELGLSPGDFVVGWVGTFGQWHGMSFIRAAIEADRSIKWLIIGDGLGFGEFKASVGANAILLGRVEHGRIPGLLATCDALVSASRNNMDGTGFFGSPTKLFEYMAMGKPILTTYDGQPGKILTHGKDCLKFLGGDGLVGQINELRKDEARAAMIGKNAFALAQNYTWDAVLGRSL
jgi:glycosyltransferase involved in cell wall biosynthesis